MKVVKNDISKFIKKINGSNFTVGAKNLDRIANAIAEEGVEIAESNFAGSENVVVSKRKIGKGRSRIIAKGDKVSFIEFGTGIAGEGTYPVEKLPTQLIQFESPKGKNAVQRSTDGWQYDYRYKQAEDKSTVKHFVGMSAKMPMYRTSRELKSKMSEIAREVIKGERI